MLPMSEHFTLGVAAAKAGKTADECPYPTGLKRQEWLAGYFSIRPQVDPSPTDLKGKRPR
jgi:ribosome modulation factor